MTTKSNKEAKKPIHKPQQKGRLVAAEVELESQQEVAVIEQPLVPQDYKTKLTRPQVELIKTTIAKGATDDELKMFLYVCERTRLDPFTKQIHLVPRWDSRQGKEIRTPIVGIDGLRSIAERSGEYAGNDDPIFDNEDTPTKATVTVYKIVQGIRSPFTASARWTQYYPGDKQGFMWNKMKHLMLGKCAEALALRKAFPAVMSGLYVAEEIQQAQSPATAQNDGPESDFDKAKRLIPNMKNMGGLEDLRMRLEGSKKYTAKEKKELLAVVESQIDKVMQEAPAVVIDPDATRNVPTAQHAEDGRNIAEDL